MLFTISMLLIWMGFFVFLLVFTSHLWCKWMKTSLCRPLKIVRDSCEFCWVAATIFHFFFLSPIIHIFSFSPLRLYAYNRKKQPYWIIYKHNNDFGEVLKKALTDTSTSINMNISKSTSSSISLQLRMLSLHLRLSCLFLNLSIQLAWVSKCVYVLCATFIHKLHSIRCSKKSYIHFWFFDLVLKFLSALQFKQMVNFISIFYIYFFYPFWHSSVCLLAG